MKHNPIADSKNPIAKSDIGKHKLIFQPKCVIKSNLDCCRDLIFTTDENYLASVSEDCLLKIWKVMDLQSLQSSENLQPYFTFRGHTGALFTLSSGHYKKGSTDAELIYTGGLEGVIRIWGIPNYSLEPYAKTNGKNFCIGVWASHKDVIWQLIHHPTDVISLLLEFTSICKCRWNSKTLERI